MVSEREKRVQQLESELKKSNDSNKEMKKQIDGLS
jgi:hypothetical protein